ncbi:MAG: hypothetical protein NTZ27_04490 [Ignavibacteriales bacterium]|nr:hypothetical protein [Ignavibacteriales bacterium]
MDEEKLNSLVELVLMNTHYVNALIKLLIDKKIIDEKDFDKEYERVKMELSDDSGKVN